MKLLLFLTVLLLLLSCGNDPEAKKPLPAEEISQADTVTSDQEPVQASVPVALPEVVAIKGYKEDGKAEGDLDGDGIPEKVIVYTTPREGSIGMERELRIYKAGKTQWELWHTSIGPLLSDQHGGMMGDPFEYVEVKRGSIVICHYGGSMQKWHYTHRYRYQNDNWKLIGTTIGYGTECNEWETLDYNFSTGKVIWRKETQECEDTERKTEQTGYKEWIQKPLRSHNMDGFAVGENELKVPERYYPMYY